MTNRIGLCGSVSVGKTSLVKYLATLPLFKDYSIRVERSKYLRDLGIPLNTDSSFKGQNIFLSERITELMSTNIITDRTIIDVMAFTNSAKSITMHQKEIFEQYAVEFLNEYDYIFYVSPIGVEIEDNNVRETNKNYRETIDFSIKYLLKTYSHRIKNLHYIPPNLNTPERAKFILEKIKI